jgi:hypothetical protein
MARTQESTTVISKRDLKTLSGQTRLGTNFLMPINVKAGRYCSEPEQVLSPVVTHRRHG